MRNDKYFLVAFWCHLQQPASTLASHKIHIVDAKANGEWWAWTSIEAWIGERTEGEEKTFHCTFYGRRAVVRTYAFCYYHLISSDIYDSMWLKGIFSQCVNVATAAMSLKEPLSLCLILIENSDRNLFRSMEIYALHRECCRDWTNDALQFLCHRHLAGYAKNEE